MGLNQAADLLTFTALIITICTTSGEGSWQYRRWFITLYSLFLTEHSCLYRQLLVSGSESWCTSLQSCMTQFQGISSWLLVFNNLSKDWCWGRWPFQWYIIHHQCGLCPLQWWEWCGSMNIYSSANVGLTRLVSWATHTHTCTHVWWVMTLVPCCWNLINSTVAEAQWTSRNRTTGVQQLHKVRLNNKSIDLSVKIRLQHSGLIRSGSEKGQKHVMARSTGDSRQYFNSQQMTQLFFSEWAFGWMHDPGTN